MASLDTVNFPEHLALYTPFVSGLGIAPATYSALGYNHVDRTDTDLLIVPADSFAYLLLKDVPFFNALNTRTSWAGRINLFNNTTFSLLFASLSNTQAVLSGFTTGVFPPTRLVGRGNFRAIEKIFTANATITSLSARTIDATTVQSPLISATTLTALSVFAPYLSSSLIESLSAQINSLTSLDISATNATIDNLSALNLSATNGVFDNLTATQFAVINFSATNATIDNLTALNLSATDATIDNIASLSISATDGVFDNLTSLNISATNATIDNLTSLNISATDGVFDNLTAAHLSTVDFSATKATIDSLTSLNISATNGIFDNLSALNLSAADGIFDNLTSNRISAHEIITDLLTATSGNITSLVTKDLTSDNVKVNADLTSDTIHVRDLFISGTCTGCPTNPGGPGGPPGSSVFDGLTAEYIEIINHHKDIPAFRVTQYWDQPLAIFFDVTGHPERNFSSIVPGGIDIPGVAGEASTLILTRENELVRMGSNGYGQLATTTNPVLTAERTGLFFDQISIRGATVLGLSGGSVFAWGYNIDGQVGDGTVTNTSSPTNVFTPSGATVASIAAGGRHSSIVLSNGNVYTWGSNINGQLGRGLNNTLLLKETVPTLIPETGFLKIASGGQHTLAIKADGSLWAWGDNSQGQIGDGTTIDRLSPVLIDNTRIYTQISCGTSHSAAIDKDNNLFVWGSNGYNQVGDGTTTDALAPVFIGIYKQVSCGFFHTVALTPAGEMYGWGRNHKHQLINTPDSSVPTATVLDPTRTYTKVFAGKDTTFGIDAAGSTIGLGDNENHQLGFATLLEAATPTTVATGLTSGINVAMIIDGSEERPGFVGINTATPNKHLAVNGDISAAGTIFGDISSNNSIITNLTSDNAVLSAVTIDIANINFASVDSIISDDIFSNTLIANDVTINDLLNATAINVTNLTALNAVINNKLSAVTGHFTDLTSHSAFIEHLTADDGKFNTNLTVVKDLTVDGKIFGDLQGNITTKSALLTSLTTKNAIVTDTLGVGLSVDNAFDIITAANAKLFVSGSTVITDSLSVLGSNLQVDAASFFTSGIRISNPHTETCLVVSQSGGLPVAEFYYTHAPWEQNQIALFIDGYAFRNDLPEPRYRGGHVGIKTKNPNEVLTVNGNISSNGNILTDTGTVRANTVSCAVLSADIANFGTLIVPNLTISGDLKANTLEITTSSKTDTLTARKATITDSLSVANVIEAGLVKAPISATEAKLISLTATSSILSSVSSHDILADVGQFTHLDANSAIFTNLTAQNLFALSANITDGVAVFSNLTATSLSALSLTSQDYVVENELSAKKVKADQIDTIVLNASTGNFTGDVSINGNVAVGNELTVTSNATFNSNLSVSEFVFVTKDVTARRFFGEVIGPTVSIGTSAELFTLSARQAHINDLLAEKISATEITALTAKIDYLEKLNTNTGYISSLTADFIDVKSLKALSANIADGEAVFSKVSAASGFFTNLSAATADITHLIRLDTPLAFIIDLSATNTITTNLTATSSKFGFIKGDTANIDRLTAQTITINNTAVNTNLIVTQHGARNLAEFYFKPAGAGDGVLSPAFVVNSNGFVGIDILNPGEALTVNGNISSSGFAIIMGDVGIGASIPRSKLDVDGKIWGTDLEVTGDVIADSASINTVRARDVFASLVDATSISAVGVNVTGDLHVAGLIFGNLRGAFNGVGVNIFEEISTKSLTSDFIQSTTITATNIFVPGGDSNKWNKAYNVPITINMVIDGSGVSIEPGVKSFIEIPYDVQLESWSLYADAPCTEPVAVVVLSSDFVNYPTSVPIHPTPPTLSPTTVKNKSSTLTSWSTGIAAGTVLFFEVSTVALPGGFAPIESTLMTLCLKGMRV